MDINTDRVRAYFSKLAGKGGPPPPVVRAAIARLAHAKSRRGSWAPRILVAACALALGLGLAGVMRPSPSAGEAAVFCQKYDVNVKLVESFEFLRGLMSHANKGGI